MLTSVAHIILVGYILVFYTQSAAAGVAQGDILNHVLSELSDLKIKVNACEEKLAGIDDRVPSSDELLRVTEFYERRFAKMEDMLLAADYKLKSTEKNYERKLAVLKNELNTFKKLLHRADVVENRLIADEHKEYTGRLMKSFPSEVNLNSTEHFYNKKLTKAGKNISTSKDKVKAATEEFSKLNSGKRRGEDTIAQVMNHSMRDESSGGRSESSSEIPFSKRLLGHAVSHRVAFTAVLSDHVSGLGKQQTIPFDQVLLNEGSAYDPVLHAFICPVNGIYMFQSAVNCVQNEYMQTELVKDDTVLVRMYSSGATGSDGYDQGFNAAIVQCNSGERIWVRVHYVFGTAIFSWRYSSFSGYILWEI